MKQFFIDHHWHIQIMLLFMSGITSFLITSRQKKIRRVACIIGLLNQPLWFITTWVHDQWGIFVLAIWITYTYARGLRNNWNVNDTNDDKKSHG